MEGGGRVSKKVLGAEHLGTLTSMNNLAFTWKIRAKIQRPSIY
jgi:hypothetical protein